MWKAVVAPVAGAIKSVAEFGQTVVKRMTEREKLSHEQRKAKSDAEKRKKDTPRRDPSDTLGDGTF